MATDSPTTSRARRSALDIEASAQACLQRCTQKLGLKEIPIPVPVDLWIEGPLGIRFGVSDLSHLGDNVLGAAFISENEILVSEILMTHMGATASPAPMNWGTSSCTAT